LIFTFAFIADVFFKPDDILILLGTVAGIIIGSGIRYLVKKDKIKEDKIVLYTVIAIIILIIFMRTIGSYIMERSEDMF